VLSVSRVRASYSRGVLRSTTHTFSNEAAGSVGLTACRNAPDDRVPPADATTDRMIWVDARRTVTSRGAASMTASLDAAAVMQRDIGSGRIEPTDPAPAPVGNAVWTWPKHCDLWWVAAFLMPPRSRPEALK